MESKLTWNVYHHDFNSDKIEVYNIFRHGTFNTMLYEIKRKYKAILKTLDWSSERTSNKALTKWKEETFEPSLDNALRYCFWCKSEYEIILTSWPPYIKPSEIDDLNKERELNPDHRVYIPDLTCEEKVDIYSQVRLNWPLFVEYVWNNLHLIKNSPY